MAPGPCCGRTGISHAGPERRCTAAANAAILPVGRAWGMTMEAIGPTVRRTGERRGTGRTVVVVLLLLGAALIAAGTAPQWLGAATSLIDDPSASAEIAERLADTPVEAPVEQPRSETPVLGPAADVDPGARQILDDQQLAAIVEAYHDALDAGDLSGALHQARLYIEGAPGDGYGYVLRGYVQWLRGRCDLTIPDMTRGITLEPTFSYAYWARASCLFSRGDAAAARRDLVAADSYATHDEDLYEIAVLHGWIAYAEGNFAEARGFLRRADLRGGQAPGAVPALWLAHARGEQAADDLLDSSRVAGLGYWLDRVVLDVYAGRSGPDALRDAAWNDTRALFYLAQLRLLEGDEAEALELLVRYAGGGFSTDVEFAVAKRQIAALR